MLLCDDRIQCYFIFTSLTRISSSIHCRRYKESFYKWNVILCCVFRYPINVFIMFIVHFGCVFWETGSVLSPVQVKVVGMDGFVGPVCPFEGKHSHPSVQMS